MSNQIHRRRRIFIRKKLQGRLVAAFFSAAAIVTLFQVILLGFVLTRVADSLPSDGGQLLRHLPSLLGSQALISLMVLAPVMILVGGLETLRVLGPIYRFERYLEAMIKGERPRPCKIRDKDALQDFCVKLNQATQPLLRAADGSDETARAGEMDPDSVGSPMAQVGVAAGSAQS